MQTLSEATKAIKITILNNGNRLATFPDGSTIELDWQTGNKTVVGAMAHDYYLRSRRRERLLTKEQALKVFEGYKCKESLPKKSSAVWIVFPGSSSEKVTVSDHKSTDGKALYSFLTVP